MVLQLIRDLRIVPAALAEKTIARVNYSGARLLLVENEYYRGLNN